MIYLKLEERELALLKQTLGFTGNHEKDIYKRIEQLQIDLDKSHGR